MTISKNHPETSRISISPDVNKLIPHTRTRTGAVFSNPDADAQYTVHSIRVGGALSLVLVLTAGGHGVTNEQEIRRGRSEGYSIPPRRERKPESHEQVYVPGRKIGGELLRWRTFLSQIPLFSPRTEGMVRLAAPRFSCATPFFAVGENKCAGPFSPQAIFWGGVCFAAGEFFFVLLPRRRFFLWRAFNFFEAFFVLISS